MSTIDLEISPTITRDKILYDIVRLHFHFGDDLKINVIHTGNNWGNIRIAIKKLRERKIKYTITRKEDSK